jgi:hypothetical protein
MTRPPFSEIIPGVLYLGGARKAETLRAAGIRNDPQRLLAVVACLERRFRRRQVPLYLHRRRSSLPRETRALPLVSDRHCDS